MKLASPAWRRAVYGALGAGALAALHQWVIRIPNPGVFYVLAITCAGFLGGLPAMLGALPILIVSIVFVYSDSGRLFSFSGDALLRMIVVLSSLPVAAVIVAILKARADRNVAMSEQSFHSLVQAMPYGIMVEQDGKWVFANPAAVQLFNAPSASDLLRRSIWQLLDEKHHQRASERAAGVDAGERVTLEERTLVRLDGTRVEAESALARVELEGRPGRLMVMRDVTKRHSMEQRIREQLADLELVNEVSRALLFGMSTAEIPQYLCGIVCERLRVRSAWLSRLSGKQIITANCHGEEPPPVPMAGSVDPDPSTLAIRTVKPVVVNNVMTDSRSQAWREHAARFGYTSAAVVPLLSSEQVIGVLAVYDNRPLDDAHVSLLQSLANLAAIALAEAQASEDLRRRARELQQTVDELKRNRATLELALRAGQMGTFDWDIPNNRITWSEGHARLFGMRLEEFDGRYETFASRVHPEDLEDVERAVSLARENRAGYDFEYRVVWPDASVHWVVGRGEFFYDDEGQPVRMSGVVMDITPRRLAEVRAQRQQNQLAHLLRLNLLSELASGLAHEINQPLSAISNFAGAALQMRQTGTLTDERVTEILQDMRVQAQRAGAIVRNLRAFIKDRPPETTPGDINKVVTDSLTLLNAELELNRVRPHLQLADNLPPLPMDAIQVQQVLINLLQNAIDAMQDVPADRRQVTVATIGSVDQVIVRVCDAGNGIPPEHLHKVFDSFFSTKPQGLGMGLNISRSIIEAHGGSLTAVNKPDGGACFEFVLPLEGESK